MNKDNAMTNRAKVIRITHNIYLDFLPERFEPFMLIVLSPNADDVDTGRFIRVTLSESEAEVLMLTIQDFLHAKPKTEGA